MIQTCTCKQAYCSQVVRTILSCHMYRPALLNSRDGWGAFAGKVRGIQSHQACLSAWAGEGMLLRRRAWQDGVATEAQTGMA
jgi:hypothetical protein